MGVKVCRLSLSFLYRYSVAMKKRIVVVEDPATPDVTDRLILGRVRPSLSTGRHVHPLTEPEQLRGPSEAAFARPGRRGRRTP